MKVDEFLESYESLSSFRGIKNHTLLPWYESQGNLQGIRALGFRCGCPNSEADDLGRRKDGRSRKGTPISVRLVENAKRRGLKALPKKNKRLSVRYC